jgi:hypothetical protein
MRDSVTVVLAIVLAIPVMLLALLVMWAIEYWPVTLVIIASLILFGLLE